ncbi:MAG: hypothetical protein ACRD21_03915 [Vicinamibacteria bacterium]
MRPDRFSVLLLLAACSNGSPPSDTDVERPSRGVAHGDHTPYHEGLVLMHGDLHFEVVLDRGGRHRVYLTDAVRNELPASAASEVRIIVIRSETQSPEALELAIDEFGESWIASGRPVEDGESRALVSLVHEGRPYEIELPFFAADVPDPHAAH